MINTVPCVLCSPGTTTLTGLFITAKLSAATWNAEPLSPQCLFVMYVVVVVRQTKERVLSSASVMLTKEGLNRKGVTARVERGALVIGGEVWTSVWTLLGAQFVHWCFSFFHRVHSWRHLLWCVRRMHTRLKWSDSSRPCSALIRPGVVFFCDRVWTVLERGWRWVLQNGPQSLF